MEEAPGDAPAAKLCVTITTVVGVPLGEAPTESDAEGVPVGLADCEGVEVWLAQALQDCVGEGVTLALAPGLSDAVGVPVGVPLCVAEVDTLELAPGLNDAVGEADAVIQALAGTLAPPVPEASAGPALELVGVPDAPSDAPVAAL